MRKRTKHFKRLSDVPPKIYLSRIVVVSNTAAKKRGRRSYFRATSVLYGSAYGTIFATFPVTTGRIAQFLATVTRSGFVRQVENRPAFCMIRRAHSSPAMFQALYYKAKTPYAAVFAIIRDVHSVSSCAMRHNAQRRPL